MPRQKTPTSEEMARFVVEWSTRFGSPDTLPDPLPTRGADHERLKAAYQGWAAVQWVEVHGQRLEPDEVAALLGGARVRACNSAEKQLWRERVLFVAPLGHHYRLPAKVWQWVLRAGVAAGHLPAVVAPAAAPAGAAPAAQPYLLTLANKPSVLIDRATRGPDGWNDATLQYREAFEDGLTLNYYEENAGADTLRQQLQTLDPRTSDVWRLLTAKALEQDRYDLFTPITIKPGELARALGLKPHPNGNVRTEMKAVGLRGPKSSACPSSTLLWAMLNRWRLQMTWVGSKCGALRLCGRPEATAQHECVSQVGQGVPGLFLSCLWPWMAIAPNLRSEAHH